MHRIADEGASDAEKVNKVVQYVRSNYKWDGTYTHMATQKFNEFIKTRTGSSAEMNLLLVNLLRLNGITSDPVLIRTSDLGNPERLFPVKNQFNHLIASAQIGGKVYVFDVTGEDAGRLNKLDMGTEGWIVSRSNPGWIQTNPPEKLGTPSDSAPSFNL
jgi:transglutaminase-like putative cysteine protease